MHYNIKKSKGLDHPVYLNALQMQIEAFIVHQYTSASTLENLSSKVCKQQRRRPDCASMQSDHLSYLIIGKYHI